jgi:hypothetical protein
MPRALYAAARLRGKELMLKTPVVPPLGYVVRREIRELVAALLRVHALKLGWRAK